MCRAPRDARSAHAALTAICAPAAGTSHMGVVGPWHACALVCALSRSRLAVGWRHARWCWAALHCRKHKHTTITAA